MAPKLGRKFKTRANRNPVSSFSSGSTIEVRFLTEKSEEAYETLNKYRSIWDEREIVLSELDPSICRNFAWNWVSLCEMSKLPIAALIIVFYSNISVYSEVIDGHYLTTWICG